MRLLTTEAYYQQLLASLAAARSRIVLAAMDIVVDDKTRPVFEAVQAALRRGVSVTILVDNFFTTGLTRGNIPAREYRQTIIGTQRVFAGLAAQGVNVILYGRLGLNPHRGRSHIKIVIADHTVFSFGGVNLTGNSFIHTDYMVMDQSAELADTLAALVAGIAGPQDDRTITLDQQNTVLFDGGQPGRSVIYDQACQLAGRSRRIHYVSQLVPTGRLAGLIRRTQHDCYFNRISRTKSFVRLSLIADSLATGLRNRYRGETFLHAKFILFELADGSKALLSGSHNFNWRGVAYGTQEIALVSTDEALWRQLYDFLEEEVVSVS